MRELRWRLFDNEFLAVAHWPAPTKAILNAALTTVDSCDLQLLIAARLHICDHHGFNREFLDFFAIVDATSATTCGRALATSQPVPVEDVTRSRVFAAQSTVERMLDTDRAPSAPTR